MSSIQTGIELNDQFTSVIYNIIGAVNMVVSSMEDMQQTINSNVDTSGIQSIRDELNQATMAVDELTTVIDDIAQPINDNIREQERFNNEIRNGTNNAGELHSVISKVGTALFGMAAIKKAVGFIEECTDAFDTQLNSENQLAAVLANTLEDEYVLDYLVETQVIADTEDAIDEINAISSNVDDVVITVEARTDALQAEFDAITAKAAEIQSKGIYGDEAMIAGAAELSTYFADPKAIEMMMDTLSNYAMGMSGGGELDTTAMVDYATGLGKVMSGAYDAMTKKGFEFSEAQQKIIEGTATEEQIAAALGEEYLDMSADMQAAAAITQVIDESWAGLYETMSDTPQGQIIQLKNAWGDLEELIGEKLYPAVLNFLNVFTNNWDKIEGFVNGFAEGLYTIIEVLGIVIDFAMQFFDFVADNWSIIEPIVWGIIAALIVYNATMGVGWLTTVKDTAAKAAHAVASGVQAAATFATTVAQQGLNAALAACPITWIIIGLIALIAIFYAVVAAINKLTGSTYSATGIICGIFAVAFAFIGNGFITIWNIVAEIVTDLYNAFASFANFIGNLFNDPIAAVVKLVVDMGDAILGVVEGALEALSWVTFGLVDYTDDISRIRSNMNSWFEENYGDRYTEYVEKVDPDFLKMDKISYDDAWDAGYSFGEDIEDAVSSFSLSDLFNNNEDDDYRAQFDDLTTKATNIADDTDSISDTLDITEEDLKYLRDIAEQETVNRFTTAEITIEQTNNNNVSGSMDLDGVVSGLTDAVNEAVDIITEGVHD